MTQLNSYETASVPVLFDMDGVLLEGRRSRPGTYATATDRAIDELGMEPDGPDRELLREYRCDEAVEAICDAHGVSLSEFWRLKEVKASAVAREQFQTGERQFHNDAAAAVTTAKNRPSAVVSNNRHKTVDFITNRHPIGEAADVVRGRDPTPTGFHRRKPNPYYLTETLEKLGVDTGVYVGDRQKDVLAAHRAGLAGILLARPAHSDTSADAEAGDAEAGDADLLQPDATIASLTELETSLAAIVGEH
ncbi:MAG: haloacid dehalogenase family protein [halophilic archaeon J07HX5]|jgi:Predicted phosphatases|nr:MAG: haloacid dehalogenase family protein [halophilic archaeon J07HX5]